MPSVRLFAVCWAFAVVMAASAVGCSQGIEGKTVDELIDFLQHENPKVRYKAATKLGEALPGLGNTLVENTIVIVTRSIPIWFLMAFIGVGLSDAPVQNAWASIPITYPIALVASIFIHFGNR